MRARVGGDVRATNTTASAGVIFFLAGAATAFAIACTHELDDFKKGRADTSLPDTAVDPDSTVDGDAEIDSNKPDLEPDADTEGPDTRDTAVSEVDTGPPAPEVSCTAVGPPGTICIAAATFDLGAANGSVCAPSGCPSETPEVSVSTSPFFIDEHEVTVGRFRTYFNSTTKFWPSTGVTIFSNGTTSLKWRSTWPSAPSTPPTTGGCFWRGPTDNSNDDKPINCVGWYDALVFCLNDSGKRLPTDAEWELVATGAQNRLFPWSPPDTEDDPLTSVTCDNALFGGTCTPAASGSTSTLWGLSRWGARNMAGSLAEWTLDAPSPSLSVFVAGTLDPFYDVATSTTRMTRGGSWISTGAGLLRAASRPASGSNALTNDAQIGFRCVKRP